MSDSRKRDRDDRYDGQSSKRHSSEQEGPVSTLHVAGLPADVKERELRLLVSFLPGLQGAVLCKGNTSARTAALTGFIKFDSQAYAVAAAHALHGYVFDEDTPEVKLRVSLAKRDMSLGGRSRPVHPDRMGPYGYPALGDQYAGYGGMYGGEAMGYAQHMAGMGGMGGGGGYRDGAPLSGHGGQGGHGAPAPAAPTGPPQKYGIKTKASSTDPIDTLCLRGLPAFTQEQLVEDLFSATSGYRGLKLFESKGLAFILFTDADAAQAVMEGLEGQSIELIGSTGREDILIEYARRTLRLD